MRSSLLKGLSFGLTSATITTLGLMVGLESGTSSRVAVIGGIITIAIADAFSDALGMHVSEESENEHSGLEVWESTLATFAAKFIFALTFLLPVFFLPLPTAVALSIAWGLGVLFILSFIIARTVGENPFIVIAEHILIAIAVIVLAHYVGHFVKAYFIR